MDVIFEYGLSMVAHKRWRPGFTEVWDCRFSGPVDIVPRDIPQFLELERITKEALTGSETIVIVQRGLIFDSVSLYAWTVKPLGRVVKAVRTAQEASAMLGVPEIPDLSAL